MDAFRRHSRSTWPVSMRPLHAGTQEEKMTRESKKQRKHTRKEQIAGGKSSAKGLALAGNSTPALKHTHTPSQCCQSAGERIRSSTQQTYTPPSATHQWTRKRRDTPPPLSPVRSHGQRHTATARSQQTQRTRSKQSPKEPHAEAIPHPSTTRRLTPRGHAERTVSPIELIRRPSLKNASVSDGP
ncbi:hypothetical protein TcG_12047 [Trypanosoma cruzi]|nr:hypothetical protein TcG_12047 [Trypanosoma cruzi]